jgi:PRMT5 oligomerisation domain
MFSWFPIFFPLRVPVQCASGTDIELHFWRINNNKNVRPPWLCPNKWVWPERFIRTLFYEWHRTTDPFFLSLLAFYTLQHNIIWCNPATRVSHTNVFTSSTYLKNVSCLMWSQRWVSILLKCCSAGILAARWYSVIHSTVVPLVAQWIHNPMM